MAELAGEPLIRLAYIWSTKYAAPLGRATWTSVITRLTNFQQLHTLSYPVALGGIGCKRRKLFAPKLWLGFVHVLFSSP